LWRREPGWLIRQEGVACWIGRTWVVVCCGMSAYVAVSWALRRWTVSDGGALLANETQILDMPAVLGFRPVGDCRTSWQSRIPGNQILEVHLQCKTVTVGGLPQELDGLRILHVSDLHMTGQLQREFFTVALQRANAWEADLVAITGDLVDNPDCIEWIPATLGRLTHRFGAYALLGNHDQRLDDTMRLRRAITDCDMIDIGGCSMTRRIRDVEVLLAGNECPWFAAGPDLLHHIDSQPRFSILLSHSPDSLPWARRHRFDLMLAGHTHGGQIRFPLIGPVVCPSRYGVRYASGLFHVDPVLMHVSRGLSGVHTLRFLCPPEITLLQLRCPQDGQEGAAARMP